jgi:hypothetical protein
VPWPDHDGEIGILIELTPALQPQTGASRSLTVVINRDYRFHCRLVRADTLFLRIDPAHRLAPELQIDFESDDPAGVPGDDRKLTFAIHRILLIGMGKSHAPASVRRARLHSPVGMDETMAAAERAIGFPVATLMASFESLGNICDFGLLQRALGADLLGLLRFGGVDIRGLVRGILDKFSSLATAGPSDVRVEISDVNDYFVIEKHYGIGWHTLLAPNQASPEQIAPREVSRLPLLRRKFAETIDEAHKTFILHRPEGLLRAQVDAVVEALRLQSDCAVLWVEKDNSRAGEVEALSSYLMKGYLDNLGDLGNPSRESWLSVCANAHLIRGQAGHSASHTIVHAG